MVGKDKGKQGTVMSISRDTNEVLVEGMHCKLEVEVEGVKKLGIDETLRWKEQPLRVDKEQVKLVDPNDNEPCEAKYVMGFLYVHQIPPSISSFSRWTLNTAGDEYIRISERSERTYVPKLASFEEEIAAEMGIKDFKPPKPTYWY
ncbi:unnamed protein product [Cylicostephanus goldi]|uniref:KOW domain-containing protein n=1 Tax=Cylicostephanus goldi TaxID=71465 RepID=A0A3P6RJU9_CYLGO|nr:unnamed protein product [Cylicostephanus goldi]